jgi:hypothetical protein
MPTLAEPAAGGLPIRRTLESATYVIEKSSTPGGNFILPPVRPAHFANRLTIRPTDYSAGVTSP